MFKTNTTSNPNHHCGWKNNLALYLAEILDEERLKAHFTYTFLIWMMMTGIWWHIYSFQWLVAFISLIQSALFSCAIYFAVGLRSFLFYPIKTNLRKVLLFGCIVLSMLASVLIIHLIDPLLVSSLTCAGECKQQIDELKHMHANDLGENILFSAFLCGIFLIMGWAYENIRLKLRHAMEDLRAKEINEQRLSRLKIQAELQALQASINPHFLYNTLNSIASLISTNPDNAERAVILLSDLFRSTLKHSLQSRVSLEESLEQVELYLRLEKLRFGDRLNYKIQSQGESQNILLPVLLLQPLVENAVKHGIGPKINGGLIEIQTIIDEFECHIIIKDDGVGWGSATESGSGHGLVNVRERLRLLFGEQAQLEIRNHLGVEVHLHIPRHPVNLEK